LDADTVDGKHLSQIYVIDQEGLIQLSSSSGGACNEQSYTLERTIDVYSEKSSTPDYMLMRYPKRKVIVNKFQLGLRVASGVGTVYTKGSYQLNGGSEIFLPEHSTTSTTVVIFEDTVQLESSDLLADQIYLTYRVYNKTSASDVYSQSSDEKVYGKRLIPIYL